MKRFAGPIVGGTLAGGQTRSRLSLLLLLIILSLHLASAQISALFDTWRWSDLGPTVGLPPGRVIELCETIHGDVWAQTSEGIAWFDGYRWNPVAGDTTFRNVLSQVRIAPDSTGLLITAGGRLYHADRSSIRQIRSSAVPQDLHIERAFALREGGVILESTNALYRVRAGDFRIIPSPYHASGQLRDPEQTSGLLQTENKLLWLNTHGGLFRWQDDGWKNWVEDTGGSPQVTALAENERGDGLVALVAGGIGRLYEWDQKHRLSEVTVPAGVAVLSAAIASNGDAIVLLVSGEVRMRTSGRWSTLEYMPQRMVGATLFRYRSNGDLWVGTEEGLFLCRLSSKMWSSINLPGTGRVFNANELLLTRGGALWWGTSNGVHRMERGVVSDVIDRINDKPVGVVTGLAEDPDGKIWISSGSSFTGAYRWDGVAWKHFGKEEGLDAEHVHRITRDRRGRLWFLSVSSTLLENEKGAFLYDEGRFINYGEAGGLPDGRVYSMAEDSTGGLWFGTFTGLARLKDGKWKAWTKRDGLVPNKVFALVVDQQNRLWFGHQNGGLGYIDQNDEVRYIAPEDGPTSANIWSLTLDRTGRLWVGTRSGICTYADGRWSTITVQNGLPNVYVWPILPLEDVVLVGTQGAGIAVFRRGLIPEIPPRVRFNDPLVRRQETVISWVAESNWGVLPPDRIETRYRLDRGFWSGWSTRRYVVLTALSSGEHVLEVQGKSLLGEINVVPAARRFEILPPLYLRPQVLVPFLSLLVLLFGTGTIFYIRKREYDRELRQQDARYRAVVEQQTELIARVQTDGKLSFVNDAFCRFVGRRRDEIVGLPIFDVVHPQNAAQLDALLQDRSGGPVAEDDLRLQDADERTRWIHFSALAIADSPEAITEVQLVGRDITEQKSTRDELAENERRNRIVLEQTGQLVYDYDLKSGNIHWSGAIQEVTGFTPAEFESVDAQGWEDRIHPEDRVAAIHELERVKATGDRYQMEYRFLQRNGSYAHMMDNGIFLQDSHGKAHRMLGTMNDITTRKLAEEQITSSLKEKEVLLKEVHHRVKNNLQVISSLLNLQTSVLVDKHALAQLRESQDRIRSMALIHERLYQSENLALVNFGEYLRDLANSLFRSYGLGRVRLKISIQPLNLGVNVAIPCGLIVNELLTNALKYAFPEGREGEVELSFAHTDAGSYMLTVRDDGIGFPAGLDFRRSPSLGLQLVNTLTMQIDGTIEMSRDPGTTFSITFPPES
jgi:PAS domain S-box-containing protein